eukprot:CAMPEP_0185021370 /NCGR_PEP_ID=MMETSP1103-20130426/4058_1 /TAXON_ID=36769 /ORGANISM="Paraphysomonas bandaiensis, Strain Caron Lab Isolate" /LENGTH=518 /DNA_ID=CAMNT_0027552855 /DNA_START=37 /DNA_END=1593 /DNA_ORIENTATION=+
MSSGFTPINQVRLTNVAYVRLNKNGKRFEIACYRNKVVNWRNKVETDLDEVLQIQSVFSNVSKGMLASKADMMDAFGTSDEKEICKEILDRGDMQVSELERQALLDGMFRDVASIVAEKAINTETGRPYSISMIQNAMKDIHYSVGLTKSAKQQALDVIRKLRKVMPIARVSMHLRITCPQEGADSVLEMLQKKSCSVLRTTPSSHGSSHIVEFTVDPEHYRFIEEQLASLTQGLGLLEVLHQQATVKGVSEGPSSATASSLTTTSQAISPGSPEENKDSSTSRGEEDNQSTSKASVDRKPAAVKGKRNKLNGGTSDPADLLELLTIEKESVDDIPGIVKPKKKNRKKQSKEAAPVSISLESESDSDTECVNGCDTPSSATSNSQDISQEPVRKGGNKQGKKNKRLQREKEKSTRAREQERESRLQQLQEEQHQNEHRVDEKLTQDKQQEAVMSGSGAGGKCNTCGIKFDEQAQHRAHYRSEWHRCNLKRKLKNLPLAKSEIEFNSYPIDHWEVDIDS